MEIVENPIEGPINKNETPLNTMQEKSK